MIFHSLPPAACWIVLLAGKVGILLAINATCPDKSTIPSPLQAGFPHNSAQDGQSCPVAKKSQGPHLSNKEKKPYNILSLDGGGSRGVMEAVILKDLMSCLTLVQSTLLPAPLKKCRLWAQEGLFSGVFLSNLKIERPSGPLFENSGPPCPALQRAWVYTALLFPFFKMPGAPRKLRAPDAQY